MRRSAPEAPVLEGFCPPVNRTMLRQMTPEGARRQVVRHQSALAGARTQPHQGGYLSAMPVLTFTYRTSRSGIVDKSEDDGNCGQGTAMPRRPRVFVDGAIHRVCCPFFAHGAREGVPGPASLTRLAWLRSAVSPQSPQRVPRRQIVAQQPFAVAASSSHHCHAAEARLTPEPRARRRVRNTCSCDPRSTTHDPRSTVSLYPGRAVPFRPGAACPGGAAALGGAVGHGTGFA